MPDTVTGIVRGIFERVVEQMMGWKVTVMDYSGKLHGDEVVYTVHAAAQYLSDEAKRKEANRGRQEEAGEVKFFEVGYIPLDDGRCLVGRTVHQLSNELREELVKQTAISKLNDEEREALGL